MDLFGGGGTEEGQACNKHRCCIEEWGWGKPMRRVTPDRDEPSMPGLYTPTPSKEDGTAQDALPIHCMSGSPPGRDAQWLHN